MHAVFQALVNEQEAEIMDSSTKGRDQEMKVQGVAPDNNLSFTITESSVSTEENEHCRHRKNRQ